MTASRALASLAVAPVLFAAYPLYLWRAEGDPWAFLHAQKIWSRHLSPAGPLGGIWDGLRAGWAGVEQLASGSHTHVYWTPVQDTDPIRAATINLECLAFLVLFVVLAVIAWRRSAHPTGSSPRSASRFRSASRASAGRCCRSRASA